MPQHIIDTFPTHEFKGNDAADFKADVEAANRGDSASDASHG